MDYLIAGFSVSRSFREAPQFAEEIQAVLKEDLPVASAAKRVWERLWTDERRAQVRTGVVILYVSLCNTLPEGRLLIFI